jgi:cell wall-associated NlpC family hydrolase
MELYGVQLPQPSDELKKEMFTTLKGMDEGNGMKISKVADDLDLPQFIKRIDIDQMQFGDVVYMRKHLCSFPAHVGLCIGRGKIIHATDIGVIVSHKIDLAPRILAAYRINK